MKVLILSFYYYPDLCAGSFRCKALVEQLSQLIAPNIEIDIITTLPNRYASFDVNAPEFEKKGRLTIHRVALPSHRSGMLDQAKAFVHFVIESRKLVKQNDYVLVFATSSRLMTAALGAYIARRKKALLYLDIRDVFVDTIKDVLSPKIALWAKPLFSCIEKWTFNRAQRINLVSQGFHDYFSQRYPEVDLRFFTNGIDLEFIADSNRVVQEDISIKTALPHRLTILYAGNMGEGQGLHLIIPALAKRFEEKMQFKLIGDGGRKKQLEDALRASNCHNVQLLSPVGRKQLIQEYQQADVLFLHLNDYDAFRKVLPSKLFEYAAMGKPIWAGLSGYPAEFVQEEISNAAVFSPCNVWEAEAAFARLELKIQPRKKFTKKYARDHIMTAMADDILSLL